MVSGVIYLFFIFYPEISDLVSEIEWEALAKGCGEDI
jgi:hypothetical protein